MNSGNNGAASVNVNLDNQQTTNGVVNNQQTTNGGVNNQQTTDGKDSNKWRVNKMFLPLKLFYFFFYGASGSVIPFIGVYLKHLHLSASETGVIAGVAVLFAMCMRPLIGMAADRLSAWRSCLSMCCLGFGFAFFCVWFLPGRRINADNSSQHFDADNSSELLKYVNNRTLQHHLLRKVWKCFDSSDSVICAYPTVWNQLTCHVDHANNIPSEITSVHVSVNQSFERLTKDSIRLSLKDEEGLNNTMVDLLNVVRIETPDRNNQPCFYIDSIDFLSHKSVGDLELDPTDTSNKSPGQSAVQKVVNCLKNCSLHVVSEMDIISMPEEFLDSSESNQTNDKATKKGDYSGNVTLDFVFVVSFILIAVARSFYASSTSLADAVTYNILGPKSLKWGQQRLWGTLGTAMAVMTITITNDRMEGENYTALFFVCIGLSILASVGGFKLGAKKLPKSENFSADLARILSQNTTRVFLAKLLFLGMLCGTANNFFFWFLVDLGTNQTTLGLVVLVHCLTSVIVLRFTGLVLKRFGHVRTLYLVILAYALRYMAFSLLTSPWLALPVELLHGVTYSLMWATASSTASIVAPPGTQATCQGIAGAVYWDLGRGLGALLTGQILDILSAPWTFRLYSALCALVLPVCVFLDKRLPLHHAIDTQLVPVITKEKLTKEDGHSRSLLLNLEVHSNHNDNGHSYHNNNVRVQYNKFNIKSQNSSVEMNGNDSSATEDLCDAKQKFSVEMDDNHIPKIGNMKNDSVKNTKWNMIDKRRGYSEFDDKRRGYSEFDDKRRGYSEFDDKRRCYSEFDDKRRGYSKFDANSSTKTDVVSMLHSQPNLNFVKCCDLHQNNTVKKKDNVEYGDGISKTNGVISKLTPNVYENSSSSQVITHDVVTYSNNNIPSVELVSEDIGNVNSVLTNNSLLTEFSDEYMSETLKHEDNVLHTNKTNHEYSVRHINTDCDIQHDSITEKSDSCESLTYYCKEHEFKPPVSSTIKRFSFDPTEYQDFVKDVNRFRPKSDSLIPNLSHFSTESLNDKET